MVIELIAGIEKPDIEVRWEAFDSFFTLWDTHQKSTQLLYVIGEEHHCYIGCIGIDDGKGGLKQRYQKQYVYRSISIFGLDRSEGQKSFAGEFTNDKIDVDANIIGWCEHLAQLTFIHKYGEKNAEFTLTNPFPYEGIKLKNLGEKPGFLEDLVDYRKLVPKK